MLNAPRSLLSAVLVGGMLAGSSAVTHARDSRPIFVLTDPRGDDNGDGTLIYPRRDDLRSGDLDLLSLEAQALADGTEFEARFARPIRPTARRTIDIGGGSLDDIARYNFYTFNLDIYIDTDRVPGSGSVAALPGRKAEVDPANAWEKAICLTPRPNEARAALKRLLTRFAARDRKARGERIDTGQEKEIALQIEHDTDSRIFFPTRIHVFGSTIRFFVPSSFLGGIAKPTWSYVVAVSGADIYQEIDIGAALKITKPDPDSLMILPIEPGSFSDRFGGGRDDDPLQPPLVDIVVPAGRSQEAILKDDDPATNRPVRLPGVVPSGAAASPQ
ncbi:MAG TPA: glucodextranase DOMON-like domain-containing protein [Thermoanaerobaculia bacterium]|nr:glucodextranase DOMON-like domain-containing protein [Thermoanaerobaculia bacterium]